MAQMKNRVGRSMSTTPPIDTDLHLPDLRIRGFRGIKDLQISRLGRVTLLAGKNGVGKTTALEAVRAFAEQGRYGAIASTLWNREETVQAFDEESGRELPSPNWEALFYGRVLTSDSLVSIGPISGDKLRMQTELVPAPKDPSTFDSHLPSEVLTIQVKFRGSTLSFPTHLTVQQQQEMDLLRRWGLPQAVQCESLGPGLQVISS